MESTQLVLVEGMAVPVPQVDVDEFLLQNFFFEDLENFELEKEKKLKNLKNEKN